MPQDVLESTKDAAIFRLRENPPRLEKCLSLLGEDQIWSKANPNSNSIGSLILHLCGNMRQYGISALAQSKDDRNRDWEFEAHQTHNKSQLLTLFNSTIDQVIENVGQLDAIGATRMMQVQGFDLDGIGIIIHVTEHLSYHMGQISYMTKMMTNKDLGYYDGQDLNVKNN